MWPNCPYSQIVHMKQASFLASFSLLFFQMVKRQIDSIDHDYFILCGDLNVTLNPQIDTFNFVGQNNSKSRDSLLDVMV